MTDISDALEAYKAAAEFHDRQHEIMREDYEFARLGNQWPEEIEREREQNARPCHTINRLPTFINQVVNDVRQNTPAIRCLPADDRADVETAEILDGLIRQIQTHSDADNAYDTALDWAASAGMGFFRVNVEYAADDVFEKEIRVDRIANPFTVLPDPNGMSADGSDWKSCFVTEWVAHDDFRERYPDAEAVDWKQLNRVEGPSWADEKHVLLAEWWVREEVRSKLYLLSDGQVVMQDDYDAVKDALDDLEIVPVQERDTVSHKVTQYIMNGQEILEENAWAGKYIPIVPVYGAEVLSDGKRQFLGLTHFAKDPQRQINYWRSASTELVALAPKAPWVGKAGSFDEDDRWATANTVNHATLEYTGDAPPQRQPFAGVPAGALQEALNANDDLKAVLGMYDASLGAQGNETSGVAIGKRVMEGDTSTFHFVDNLNRAIRYAGRIIVDLIPKVYTRPQIIRIVGEDDEPTDVPINQPVDAQNNVVPEGTPEARIYDLTAGKYDVIVKAGPSFTTKRQEAATQMTEMLRTFPQAAPIIGDLVAKNLDWPGADEIAKRLKSLLPPEIRDDEDPRVAQMAQQIQQMQAIIGALQNTQALEREKVAIDRDEMLIKAAQAETDRLEAVWKYQQANDGNMIDLVGTLLKKRDGGQDRRAQLMNTAAPQFSDFRGV